MIEKDYVNTPRFLKVKIEQIFPSVKEMKAAGYREPTYYHDGEYEIYGRMTGRNLMEFAAAHI